MVTKKNITEILDLIIKEYDLTNKCSPNYETFQYTTIKGEEVTVRIEQLQKGKTFQKAVAKVVEDYYKKGEDGKIWRVDVPDLDWIKEAQLFRTDNGSTLAIRPDGDIVAVSSKLDENGHPLDNMEALMGYAIEKGGTKLDSFDGNWKFYRKCGFIPLTWLEFNKEYSPEGWDAKRDMEEGVIFMEYTGEKVYLDEDGVYNEMNNFYENNPPITEKDMIEEDESPWDAGYRIRDNLMNQRNT